MQLSRVVAAMALVLAAALVAGHAQGQAAISPPAASDFPPAPRTAQQRAEEREAQRRAAAADQQRKKDYFTQRCSKALKTPQELEECRDAYRRM